MKPISKLIVVITSIVACISCSKEDGDSSRPTTIKVVNLINGTGNVIVKTGDNPINYATTRARVAFDDFKNFSIPEHSNTRLDIVKETDTINPIYSESLSLKGIHSLYLLGDQDEQQVFFIEDNPRSFTDSIMGVRFINLSKVSGAIAVNIAGEVNPLLIGLDLESATDYMEFPVRESDGVYLFEFRDVSGNLLSNITIDPLERRNRSIKHNLSLVVYDQVLSPVSTFQRVSRINNY